MCMYVHCVFHLQGCAQAAKAIGIPSSTAVFGLVVIVTFAMSHVAVEVEGIEPVLWISICMPTGSGKSSLCKFIKGLVNDAHANTAKGASWFLDDQSFDF